MDNNRYIFDKRIIKKKLIKYGLIFLCLFPLLIVVNTWLAGVAQSAILFIDILLGLVVIFVIEIILRKIYLRKMEKEEEQKQREKRALKNKKQQQEVDVIEIIDVEVKSGKDKKNKKEEK